MKDPVTPQEKKRLSYERDRRGDGSHESNKGSRKTVPAARRLTSRAYRRKVKAEIPADTSLLSLDETADAVDAAESVRREEWKKWGNFSLAEWLVNREEHRERRTGRKQRARADRAERRA